MIQDAIVELIVDEVAYPLPAVYDASTLEIFSTPPDTHYQIDGADPTSNPQILVWYRTQGV